MFLVDTNIFLEILLKQEKKEVCKKFLNSNITHLHITENSNDGQRFSENKRC